MPLDFVQGLHPRLASTAICKHVQQCVLGTSRDSKTSAQQPHADEMDGLYLSYSILKGQFSMVDYWFLRAAGRAGNLMCMGNRALNVNRDRRQDGCYHRRCPAAVGGGDSLEPRQGTLGQAVARGPRARSTHPQSPRCFRLPPAPG